MAVYQITGPGGATYRIEGPDGADPSAIVGSLSGQPTSSAVASQSLPLQIGPWNTGINMPSWLSELAAGSGSKLADFGLGAEQIAAKAFGGTNLSDLITGQNWSQRLAAEAARKRAIDKPLLNTWGGWAGSNLTAAAPAFIPGAQGLGALTAIGATEGALTPTTGNESRLLNTTLGGAFAAGGKVAGDALGGWLSRRVGAALAPALTDSQKAALAQGGALGMRATPGQQLGSASMQQAEAWAMSHPWTAGPFAKLAGGNQAALDKAAAQAIGENASTVDATVLGRANDRLGNVFENVRNPNHIVTFDPANTGAALNQIDQDFKGLLPGDMEIRDNPLVRQLDNLNGNATAKQLGQLSSKLGKASFKQMTGPAGDRDLGQALSQVKEHVDDLLESSLSPEQQAAYAAARQQYRNLMLLTSRSGIINTSTGHVAGGALASKLQQADRPGFLYGGNQTPLYQAARFSQAFQPIVGNSGTATRMANPFDPFELALGVPSNLGARAYLSPVVSRGLLGALGAVNKVSRGAAAASRFAAPGVRYGLLGTGLAWPNSR